MAAKTSRNQVTVSGIDADVREMLRRELVRIERESNRPLIDRINADPTAHKLTTVFDGRPASYRYIDGGHDGRGWAVRFCWTNWRNAAGYFLSWREVIPPIDRRGKHAGRRLDFAARKSRKRAKALAARRAQRYIAGRSTGDG